MAAWSAHALLDALGLDRFSSCAMIGTGKNAGKTTVLNHLVRAFELARPERVLALTSIGRDGEGEDLVTGGIKPRIYVRAGQLITTASESLAAGDAVLEILAMTGIRTALGEVALVRTRSNGYVELAGPSAAQDIRRCEIFFRQAEPACLMLVDGALSRQSPAGGGLTQAAVLAAGMAGASSPQDWAEKTAARIRLLSLPALGGEITGKIKEAISSNPKARIICIRGETIRKIADMPTLAGQGPRIAGLVEEGDSGLFLRGAVTGSLVGELLKNPYFSGIRLAAEDGTRFFLDESHLARLDKAAVSLAVLHELSLPMVFVNPMRADGSLEDSGLLLQAAAESFDVPALDLGPALP